MAEKRNSGGMFVRRGVSGLEQYGGRVNEEFLRRLQGYRGQRIFKEMSENDDVIGAILFCVEMLLRNVDWRVEPYSEDPDHEDQAEFVESLMDDMESTWEDFMAEALSMLTYGYAPMEIIYKRREGPFQSALERRSKHSDGRIGWRDIAIRAQTTVDNWEFDEHGDVTGLWQLPPVGTMVAAVSQRVFIPIEKLMVFRTTARRNNPEGRSIIRNAFVSWFYKKRIQESEAIGIERDLAGMPIMWLPAEILSADGGDELTMKNAYQNIIENIKRDEQSGLMLPLQYDENGNKLYDFELAGTGSARVIDTDKVVKRYNRAIAQSVLMDFLMLGQEKAGSYALSSDKTELFATAVGAWLKSIAAVLNRQGLTKLYQLNGWDPSEMAIFVPGDIEKPDVEKFTTAITMLTGSGWLTPGGEDDENHLRGMLDMPEKVEGDDAFDDGGIDPNMPPGAPTPGKPPPKSEEEPDGL